MVSIPKDKNYIILDQTTIQKYIGLTAWDFDEKPLDLLQITPDPANKADSILLLGASNFPMVFKAVDALNQETICRFTVTVVDTTPPKILNCPPNQYVDSYSFDQDSYVTWTNPIFRDNSKQDVKVIQKGAPGIFKKGMHQIIYTAIDWSGNNSTCSFLIVISITKSECGQPWKPPHSQFTCRREGNDPNLAKQVCSISCIEPYELALADPIIKCEVNNTVDENLEGLTRFSTRPQWRPYLDESVCQAPKIAKASKH